MLNKTKVIVVLGPTASGKSELAVDLAEKYNGEIISADSRQVYKGLDLGSGKISREEMHNIKHHLIDVEDPKNTFSVPQYVFLAEKAIDEIQSKKKIPIICGGTGFYIDSLLNCAEFPEVEPNEDLRNELKDKKPEELFMMLNDLDPEKVQSMNESDRKNPRRLIRAIEIAQALGKNEFGMKSLPVDSDYDILFIGINVDKDILRDRIHKRLLMRLEAGMLDEAKKLNEHGLSWTRMEELGLEYKYEAMHLQGKLTYEEMINRLEIEINQFAKRQMTWFKRNKNINWFDSAKNLSIYNTVEDFIKK